MRRLVVIEFLSLDGVMQGLGSPEEDTSGGFTHGGWGAPYADAIHEAVAKREDNTSAYLFGRRTYEKMAAFWPHQPDENPMARRLNQTPKHVVSRSLTEVDWPGAVLLQGDLVTAVTNLKREGVGDIVVLGSGALVHQLLGRDLVEAIRLFVHPLLLGSGKRLFRELPSPRQLVLASTSTTSRGTVVLDYDFAHDPTPSQD